MAAGHSAPGALDSGSWNASALVLVLIQEARRRTEVVLAESDTVDLAECEPPASAVVVIQRETQDNWIRSMAPTPSLR